jgi:hypothetical protein
MKTYLIVCGDCEQNLLYTDLREKYFVQNFLREDRIFVIIASFQGVKRNECKCVRIFKTVPSLITYFLFQWAFKHFCKISKRPISFMMPICRLSCMGQLCSHWTDFHKILYFNFFFFLNLSRRFKLH